MLMTYKLKVHSISYSFYFYLGSRSLQCLQLFAEDSPEFIACQEIDHGYTNA